MDMGEKKMDDGSMGGMSDGMDHDSMGGMFMGCGNLAAAKPYIDANMLMHTNMAVPLTCTHTVDFVRAMIPHHKGAIAMCEVLVSEDAYLVELCVNITRVQRAEVAWMSQWLDARDHVVDAPCGHKAHIHGNCPSKKGKGKKMAKMSKAPKEMHAHGSKKGNKAMRASKAPKSAKEMRGSKAPKKAKCIVPSI